MPNTTTHLNREHSHLPFLDGLRGLMSFWVLAGHATFATGMRLPILSRPQLAVDVFMFISGFLMSYYFRLREDREPWNSGWTWQAFYIRRFFRIAPAYYLCLLIAYLFREGFNADFYHDFYQTLDWRDVLSHVTFLFGFFPRYACTNVLPDWSIGLEMQFYLALPFIMLLYRRAGHLVSTAALAAIWMAANQLFAVYSGNAPKLLGLFPQPTFLPLKINCFVVGILLAECYYFKARDFRKSLRLLLLTLVMAYISGKCLLFMAALSAVLLVYRGEPAPAPIRKLLGGAQRLFDSKPCKFLADTSYGVYLSHVLVLMPLAAWLVSHPAFVRLPGWERYLLLLGPLAVIVYPLASLIHKYIERPGIAVGKRLIRHRLHLAPTPMVVPISVESPNANA